MSTKGRIVWEMAQSIISAVYESDFGKYLWLISPSDLSPDQSLRRLDDGLRFLYKEDENLSGGNASRPGTALNEAWARYFFNFLRKQLLMMDNPLLVQGAMGMEKDSIRMELTLQSDEDVYAPIRLSVVRLTDKRIEAVPGIMTLSELGNKELSVFKVSPEAIAADHIVHILKDLELIGEMEPYLYLYELVNSASMNGKALCLCLEDRLKEANIYPGAQNRQIFSTYGSSSYMKKRWKALLRRQKIKSPAWEETHAKVFAFIDPVMDSIEREIIFFGDWMADLGRYLD